MDGRDPLDAMMAQSSGVVQTQWAAMARVPHAVVVEHLNGSLAVAGQALGMLGVVSEMCTCIPRPCSLA